MQNSLTVHLAPSVPLQLPVGNAILTSFVLCPESGRGANGPFSRQVGTSNAAQPPIITSRRAARLAPIGSGKGQVVTREAGQHRRIQPVRDMCIPSEPLGLRCHQAARTRNALARFCVAPLGLASDGLWLRSRFLCSVLALHWSLNLHQDHLFITEVQHQIQLPPPKGPTCLTMRCARLFSAWLFHRCTAQFACC